MKLAQAVYSSRCERILATHLQCRTTSTHPSGFCRRHRDGDLWCMALRCEERVPCPVHGAEGRE